MLNQHPKKGLPGIIARIALLSMVLLSGGLLSAQQTLTVKGVVTRTNNSPVEGVMVLVKNTSKGTATDETGNYSLEAGNESILVFSAVGFVSQEVRVNNRGIINITLTDSVRQLDEVVSIGYTRQRKGDLTGAISSVKAKELNLSAPTLSQALVGKVAGVQVSQVSGAPYAGAKIRVRGIGSINASSEPLYVIDGYPLGGNVSQGQGNGGNGTGGFNPNSGANDVFINPDDIESIEILKDAASAAIYGSRASGGVVLITTKRGKQGKGTVQYDYQLSLQQLANKVDLLNSTEFAELFIDGRNSNYKDILISKGIAWDDAFYSDNNETRRVKAGQTQSGCSVCILSSLYNFQTQTPIAPQYNTDWQDELYDNVLVQRHNLSFTGGNNGTRYSLSGGYLDQPGILRPTYQRRINVRANVDADVSPKLKVSANAFVTNAISREVQEGRFNQGPILGALVYMPIFPAYKEDGTLATSDLGAGAQTEGYGYSFQGIENPVALAQRVKIMRNGTRATFNASATYEVIKNLFAKVNAGGFNYSEKYEYYFPTNLANGINPPGSQQSITAANAAALNSSIQDILGEFTLNYKKDIGKGSLDALAGYSAQKTNTDAFGATARNFSNDLVQEITAGGSAAGDFNRIGTTGKSTTTLISMFGRAIYNYDQKYFVMGSYRRDASSRFGPQNRWGDFGSASVGWNLSNESFYNSWLGAGSTVKLRASWGLTGNNNIPNYNAIQSLSGLGGVVIGNNVANGVWSGNIADERLGWESTSQYNFGLDVTLFKNRVSAMVNYYVSKSYNLLYRENISALTGSTTILTNLRNSDLRNNGIDLQIDGRVVQGKDFNVNVSGNINFNRNNVKSLGGASEIQTNGAERSYITHVTREGSPVGSFYGLRVAGMVRQADMDRVNADAAIYKANGNKLPAGYKVQGFPISTFSTTPLNPGDLYFVDKNGDGVITDADKDVIGNPYPDFTYGFNVNVSYKILDLSLSFNGAQGNDVLDGQDYYIRNMEGSGNQYSIVNQRYRNEANPGNGHEYRASRGGTQSNSTRLSDYYIQDGSFFRCTNISLGANLGSIGALKKVGVSALRIYASVDNAFTVTKYLGYNPEVDFNNGSNLTPGVDYGKYPLIRSFNLGVNLQF
ncbi:MAG: TonB-dependent receptor [Chitinophagaceae bacterium]|nr:MAG: TonB-dependent receptor [Chitinophagaceae bacterium]